MKKKTRKKANKNDEIIQLLREILEELRKLNNNTNNDNLEKGWREVSPYIETNGTTGDFPTGWNITIYH